MLFFIVTHIQSNQPTAILVYFILCLHPSKDKDKCVVFAGMIKQIYKHWIVVAKMSEQTRDVVFNVRPHFKPDLGRHLVFAELCNLVWSEYFIEL